MGCPAGALPVRTLGRCSQSGLTPQCSEGPSGLPACGPRASRSPPAPRLPGTAGPSRRPALGSPARDPGPGSAGRSPFSGTSGRLALGAPPTPGDPSSVCAGRSPHPIPGTPARSVLGTPTPRGPQLDLCYIPSPGDPSLACAGHPHPTPGTPSRRCGGMEEDHSSDPLLGNSSCASPTKGSHALATNRRTYIFCSGSWPPTHRWQAVGPGGGSVWRGAQQATVCPRFIKLFTLYLDSGESREARHERGTGVCTALAFLRVLCPEVWVQAEGRLRPGAGVLACPHTGAAAQPFWANIWCGGCESDWCLLRPLLKTEVEGQGGRLRGHSWPGTLGGNTLPAVVRPGS